VRLVQLRRSMFLSTYWYLRVTIFLLYGFLVALT
jgi:hypothetical protein